MRLKAQIDITAKIQQALVEYFGDKETMEETLQFFMGKFISSLMDFALLSLNDVDTKMISFSTMLFPIFQYSIVMQD